MGLVYIRALIFGSVPSMQLAKLDFCCFSEVFFWSNSKITSKRDREAAKREQEDYCLFPRGAQLGGGGWWAVRLKV